MASNAMTTALALPSSKTNWTATVPARAPPPPPPVTQATMLKRTHEIQCGKCAISDYAENIGVWNDDGTLQELGMCGECEKPDIVGCCECCECDVTTDQDYLKLKTGPGAGRIYCEEHVGWGECQKAWSGSCGCDVCADQEEQNECEICAATPDINDDWHGNSVCDECFMCCEECSNTKNPAVFEKTASDLCECEKEDSDEVKQYKAVLAETLRYEAIMDMMKK